jgi:trans-aconitate methyltransferase
VFRDIGSGQEYRVDWQRWTTSWDRQQEGYLPDREQRFTAMPDMVEAVYGSASRVLDLACGPGSITDRVLRRFPRLESSASTSTQRCSR